MMNSNSMSTENWITVRDINNNIIFLDNKQMVTGVKIQPRNIFIMDQNSQFNVIDQLRVSPLSLSSRGSLVLHFLP